MGFELLGLWAPWAFYPPIFHPPNFHPPNFHPQLFILRIYILQFFIPRFFIPQFFILRIFILRIFILWFFILRFFIIKTKCSISIKLPNVQTMLTKVWCILFNTSKVYSSKVDDGNSEGRLHWYKMSFLKSILKQKAAYQSNFQMSRQCLQRSVLPSSFPVIFQS